LRGTVKSWNDERGFGFIAPGEGGADVFFHISAFAAPPPARPRVGEAVRFALAAGAPGKPRAGQVLPLRAATAGKPLRLPAARRLGVGLVAVALFVVLYVALAVRYALPLWVAGSYLAMSVLTYGVYARDKAAAARGAWRTPESSLHLLALAGGWPGAVLAQQFLRHKSAKTDFLVVFWLAVSINVGVLVFLSTTFARAWRPAF
jgi:uncharacterized membrane protein YsdA (DUF1294 family)/cold shock CspA family protein